MLKGNLRTYLTVQKYSGKSMHHLFQNKELCIFIYGFNIILVVNRNYFRKQQYPVDLCNGFLYAVSTEFLNIIQTFFGFYTFTLT